MLSAQAHCIDISRLSQDSYLTEFWQITRRQSMSICQVLMTLTLSHELRLVLKLEMLRWLGQWQSSKHLIIGGPLGWGWSVHVAIHVIATALTPGARAVTTPSTFSARHVILRRY